ncbi:bifunctional folylpolyglutamate synthase/dihydrofolate synthase [Kiritimatiellaeota bacterium B1221]|nr:bifunctional folylpolyglutamate synthase/dihydrofolate synthase [Kiritimatiellaeota bacterium B1221]
MNFERDQRLAALFSRTHAGIKPGLDFMWELVEALGHPQKQFLSVHVAGTNGKGSTCALLESAVQALGLTSGLFTSPHLVRVNERIRINGMEVSDEVFYDLLNQVQSVEDGLSRHPTFFETLTAMSFLAFARAGVQVAVLETGMGGRLDCTNVVEPLLSVITRIDLDHTGFLGETLAEIAGEKAGIIKSGRPVVIGAQPVEAEEVLLKMAEKMQSPVRPSGDAVSLSGRKQTLQGQFVTVSGSNADYGGICCPLLGKFQLENLCTAVAAMELLQELLGVEPEANWVKTAVENVDWRGRGQVLSVSPPLILDVAHNPGGAKALRELLQELFGKKAKGVLFFAGLADKDLQGFLETLRPHILSCVCLNLHSERAVSAEQLQKLAGKQGLEAIILPLDEARAQAGALVGDADFGCVAGSVYLGGEWLSAGTPDLGERLQE